jgi:hypothetical protein
VSAVRISLALQGPVTAELKGQVTLRSVDGPPPPAVQPVTAEGAAVEVPPGTVWDVTVEIPGYWCRRERVTTAPAGTEAVVQISVWPLGKLSGSVQVSGGKPMPKELFAATVAPRRPAARGVLLKGLVSCPVDAKGTWTCEFPASKLDLAFSAPGFSPQYRFGVAVPLAKAANLGTLVLKPGASVAGWVEVESGALAAPGCTARLVTLGGAKDPGTARTRIAERPVGKDGFFQLADLPPGYYGVEVEQAGYEPARLSPVRVAPGAETFLEHPLVLRRPLQLKIAVTPPQDWLGKAWHVGVFRFVDYSSAPDRESGFQGTASHEGEVVVPHARAGMYTVVVSDSLGNRLFSDTNFEVQGDTWRDIKIDLLTVTGTVSLGKDQPLQATLWFGGEQGIQSVKMESDATGHYLGVLPHGGEWGVDIKSTVPPLLSHQKPDVQPDDQGRATVDLTLSATRLFGTVVGEDGHAPAADGTKVVLSLADTTLATDTNADGSFEFRGLAPGSVRLIARLASGPRLLTSASTAVTLSDDQTVGPIQLRLRSGKTLSGTVSTPLGPLAGASVQVFPREPAEGFAGAAMSDLDGTFSADIPQDTTRAEVVVAAPGSALAAFDVPVDGSSADVSLANQGGDLTIALPKVRANDTLVVLQNGLPLPYSILLRWSRSQIAGGGTGGGQQFHVPMLAAGSYRVCLLRPDALQQAFSSTSPDACDDGSLAAGGALTLDVSHGH